MFIHMPHLYAIFAKNAKYTAPISHITLWRLRSSTVSQTSWCLSGNQGWRESVWPMEEWAAGGRSCQYTLSLVSSVGSYSRIEAEAIFWQKNQSVRNILSIWIDSEAVDYHAGLILRSFCFHNESKMAVAAAPGRKLQTCTAKSCRRWVCELLLLPLMWCP